MGGVQSTAAELEKTKHENAEQKDEINHQKRIIDSKDAQISQITTSTKAREAQLQAEIKQLKTNIVDLQSNLEKFANKCQSLELVINSRDSNVRDLNEALKKERATIMELTVDNIKEKNDLSKANQQQKENYEVTIAEIKEKCEKEIAEKVAAVNEEAQNRIEKVEKENARLSDPNRICTIKDVVADGNVKYKDLNGKILMVNKLENDGRKWYVDGAAEVFFERADFQICVNKELIFKHFCPPLKPGHVFWSSITKLCLADLTLSLNEYKKIVATFKSLSFRRITVKNGHGININVVDLLKEVPNVKIFEYIFKENEIFPTQKLLQFSPSPKLQQFTFSEVQEDFDLKLFAEFITSNPSIFYDIKLRCSKQFYDNVKAIQKDNVPSKNVIFNRLK